MKRNVLHIAVNFILLTSFFGHPAAAEAPEYRILIEIDENRLYLLDQTHCVKKYPISSGKVGWPSPIGDWRIAEKGRWGEGFGGRWMGLDVIWGSYGIHGTLQEYAIGRAVSHGCIRMRNQDVKELYELVPLGTPVCIRNGVYGPFGNGFRKLAPGDRGADVLAVQKRLKKLGYYAGEETGIYEDDLKLSIYRFQSEKALKIKYTLTTADYEAMGFEEFD